MNLEKVFCPNLDCPARGQCGRGNISVHSAKEKRCYCSVCQQTFSVTKGSIFYRLKTEPQMVLWVIALLAYGCPVQAIVVALGLDDRGIALCRPLLLAVDGLVSYVSAFQRAFRSPVPRWGQPGRCHLRPWSDLMTVQVVKRRLGSQLSIVRRIVQGSTDQVTRLLQARVGARLTRPSSDG